jgi:hypothetical protein
VLQKKKWHYSSAKRNCKGSKWTVTTHVGTPQIQGKSFHAPTNSTERIRKVHCGYTVVTLLCSNQKEIPTLCKPLREQLNWISGRREDTFPKRKGQGWVLRSVKTDFF